jgi:hypothetical protein
MRHPSGVAVGVRQLLDAPPGWQCGPKIKAFLRGAKARTAEAHDEAPAQAIGLVTTMEAGGLSPIGLFDADSESRVAVPDNPEATVIARPSHR